MFHWPASRREPELVYSSVASAGSFLEQKRKSDKKHSSELEGHTLEYEMFQSLGSASIAQSASLLNVCCMVRSAVKDVKPLMPRSLSPVTDLTEDHVERLVPDVLYNFIVLVIGALPEAECELLGAKVKVTSERLHRRTLPICQDIVFDSSSGRVSSPKHVSIALAIKTLTGSAQLVGILNGFGHCIADSQVREVETAMAEKVIGEQDMAA